MLYVVYQYNIISCVLSKKQDRNKINNLSDSSLFTFHLVSSFALGRTKSVFQAIFPDGFNVNDAENNVPDNE